MVIRHMLLSGAALLYEGILGKNAQDDSMTKFRNNIFQVASFDPSKPSGPGPGARAPQQQSALQAQAFLSICSRAAWLPGIEMPLSNNR